MHRDLRIVATVLAFILVGSLSAEVAKSGNESPGQALRTWLEKNSPKNTAPPKARRFWNELRTALDFEKKNREYESAYQKQWLKLARQFRGQNGRFQSEMRLWRTEQRKASKAVDIAPVLLAWLNPNSASGNWSGFGSAKQGYSLPFTENFQAWFAPDWPLSTGKSIVGQLHLKVTPASPRLSIPLKTGTWTLDTPSPITLNYGIEISLLGDSVHLTVLAPPKISPSLYSKFEPRFGGSLFTKDREEDLLLALFSECLLQEDSQTLNFGGWSPMCLAVHEHPDREWPDLGLILTLAFGLEE